MHSPLNSTRLLPQGGEVTLHNLPIDFEFVRSASVLHIWLRDNEAEGTVLAAGHKT